MTMNILLAARHPPQGTLPIGGVQSWCRTVAGELVKYGHQVTTWGPELPLPTERFDVGIIANIQDTGAVLGQCARVLNICHGIIPAERPLTSSWSVRVAFTSEEVRDFWHGTGPIVRQPIDLTFWSPAALPVKYLTRFSYRKGLGFVQTLAKGLNVRYCHLRHADPERARGVVRHSACVLASGRAALEAMACGVPVVLCDHRSDYQDALLDFDPASAMIRNYSGRGGQVPTETNTRQAIEQAMERGSMLEHVIKHHDARKITEQLLRLAA